MLTQGLGLGIGAQAFGLWKSRCTVDGEIVWSKFWYAPGIFALVVMILFFLLFWDRSVDESEEKSPDKGK